MLPMHDGVGSWQLLCSMDVVRMLELRSGDLPRCCAAAVVMNCFIEVSNFASKSGPKCHEKMGDTGMYAVKSIWSVKEVVH